MTEIDRVILWGKVISEPSTRVFVLVLLGISLATITLGLAFFSIRTILAGELTVDHERREAFRRLARTASRKDHPISTIMAERVDALDERIYFRVKEEGEEDIVVRSEAGEHPYDLGRKGNWERVMGKGWNCLRPQEWAKGDGVETWTISPEYADKLKRRARKRL